jgi:DNA-directed RNA polymerase
MVTAIRPSRARCVKETIPRHVHDSFGSLAPQARELHRIIRTQFAELYSQDVLADLRDAAGSSEPIPAKGSLDPWDVLHSEYAFA